MLEEEEAGMDLQGVSSASESISFGRFEADALSWERRSLFSHNRYLDEAEKYSPRGSVTEKKAFFEAHFKKKGFLTPAASSNLQSKPPLQDDSSAGDGEYVGDGHCAHSGEDGQVVSSDVEPESIASDRHDHQHGLEEIQQENNPASEFLAEHASSCNDSTDLSAAGSAEPDELLEDKNEPPILLEPVSAEPQHITERSAEDALSCQSLAIEENYTNILDKTEKTYVEVGPKVEERGISTMRTRSDLGNNSRRPFTDEASIPSGKAFMKSLKDMRKMMHGTKLHEQSALGLSPATPASISGKQPGCVDLKGDVCHKTRSDKGSREKRAAALPQSPLKDQPRSSTYKGKSSQVLRQDTRAFNFKTDDRAERRREFYMKLEEKMHAKEAELSEIQTRSQEKSQAEIEQFRRSLNFKATPLPSFYRESLRMPQADGRLAQESLRRRVIFRRTREGSSP